MTRIGNLQIDAPFFQAGLAGYSDTAMRLVARRHGCPYCITEAMLDRLLLAGGKGLKPALLDPQDHPIAGQIMGSEPDEMARSAELLLGLGYDAIDVNLACPVKKIRRKFRGGHLLATPEQAIAILAAVRSAVGDRAPCTVKLRRGSDDSAGAEARFHRIYQATIDLGYSAAVVHCRTVEQKYNGPSRWPFLQDLVARYGDTPGFTIGGSGDIWQAQDIFRMIEQTGVELVSVARGCIGNPWIFVQARAMLDGDAAATGRPPSIFQQRQVLLEHFHLAVQVHGESRAGVQMRKFGIRFARHHPDGEAVRQGFIGVRTIADWQAVLDRHYAEDGPGIVPHQALPDEATPTCCEPAEAHPMQWPARSAAVSAAPHGTTAPSGPLASSGC